MTASRSASSRSAAPRTPTTSVDAKELARIDAWWRAANYLSVGQIYLLDNPLLREPLRAEHVKPRLLGHLGTVPGLNLVYAHLNRVIRERISTRCTSPARATAGRPRGERLAGGHLLARSIPSITRDADGLRQLFRQFSFPGGIPSHVAPETPGSIHEGGELGYALSHAYGAAFDNPDLLVACVIGDGEAETGPLAASWHSNKFVDPARDGAVLPILHLNGYKIANPTVLARIPEDELRAMLEGFGHTVHVVAGDDPADVHRQMAATLDGVLDEIADIQASARDVEARAEAAALADDRAAHAEGLDRPQEGRRQAGRGHWRSHQVPMADVRDNPKHLRRARALDAQLPARGAVRRGRRARCRSCRSWRREGARRMSANAARQRRPPAARPAAARLPRLRGDVSTSRARRPARRRAPSARSCATSSRATRATFRLFGPDETASNRLDAVFEVTDKAWAAETLPVDEHLAPDGRVMEILSEHTCQGWLEGYLLTGRHGLFNCYEAFIHIVDSMFNQHAKWLKTTQRDPLATPDRLAQLPAVEPRLAPGPQRLLPPGSRASSTTS